MSDITQNPDSTQSNAEEPIVIVTNDKNKSASLNLDVTQMTLKALAEVERNTLKDMCADKNLFKDMKKWQIDRLSRPALAKLLKANAEPKQEETPKEQSDRPTPSSSNIDVLLLQKGLGELFDSKEPKSLDAFCLKVVTGSDKELVSEETLIKSQAYFYYGSVGYLGFRKLFGDWSTFRTFFVNLKAKFSKKPKQEEPTT
ncbi:MAG: hypothetical protein GQ570_12140 [Helicobacteraceae bacterium]|nr:hypothetical protein [Helicobacteraceae bacterium]